MLHMVDGNLVLWAATTAGVIVGVGAIARLLVKLLLRIERRTALIDQLASRASRPAVLLLMGTAAYVMTFMAPLSRGVLKAAQHGVAVYLIATTAWFIVEVAWALMDEAERRHEIEARDNLRARKIRTQVMVLRRVLAVVVGVLALAAMLTTFSQARALGASILASAGIIGLVAGVAARPALGNLIAGIQIAFTEPVRLDDVVVVEGEWGRVEEITLTYVVVRLWDQRRMVLPISYFIETPFQNWTRTTSDITGTVHLYLDYTVPVDELRAELQDILRQSPLWDGRVGILQVTDATEGSLEVRALVSAMDASTAWDLRCHVREKMIDFLQRHHPHALPRLRAELAEDRHLLAAPAEQRA